MKEPVIIGAGTEQVEYVASEAIPAHHGSLAFLCTKGTRCPEQKNTLGIQEGDDGSVGIYLAQGSMPEMAHAAVELGLRTFREKLAGIWQPRIMNEEVDEAIRKWEGPGVLRVAAMIIDPSGRLHTHRVGNIEQARYTAHILVPFANPAESPEVTEFKFVLSELEACEPGRINGDVLRQHAMKLIPSRTAYKTDPINELRVGDDGRLNQMTEHTSRWTPNPGEAHLLGTGQMGLVAFHHLGVRETYGKLFEGVSDAQQVVASFASHFQNKNPRNQTLVVYRRDS